MKKVVSSKNDQISTEDCGKDAVYACISSGHVYLLTFFNAGYTWLNMSAETTRGRRTSFNLNTFNLTETLDAAHQNGEVFQFPNHKKFGKWLSEN